MYTDDKLREQLSKLLNKVDKLESDMNYVRMEIDLLEDALRLGKEDSNVVAWNFYLEDDTTTQYEFDFDPEGGNDAA